MSDPIRSTSDVNPLANRDSVENQSAASAASLSQSFQSLLALSLFSDNNSTTTALGSSSDTTLPLMVSLMEQLIAQQVENGSSSSLTEANGQLAAAAYSSNLYGLTDLTSSLTASISSAIPNGLPVSGAITQNYHAGHNGIDIGVATGTPVKSTMDGKVVYAGWNNQGYGNLVIVENGPYQTYYAHLSDVPVSVGDTVKAGSVIGLSGSTGNSTGPHVHYEVRYQTKAIPPASFV